MACVPPPASPDRGANREGNFQKLRVFSFVFALSCERQITAQSGHDQLRFGKERQHGLRAGLFGNSPRSGFQSEHFWARFVSGTTGACVLFEPVWRESWVR